jgi:SAM-dependent methyltransferase
MDGTIQTNKINGLEVAAKHYYWKPSQAFFHSFELEEYSKAKINFANPIASLGCRDGAFETMLKEMNVLDYIDVYLDMNFDALSEIVKNKNNVVQSDVRKLPFKNSSFSTFLANDLLSSIPTNSEKDIDDVILEVNRGLKDEGLFVFTVPTPQFNENLPVPKLLISLGLKSFADKYHRNLSKRLSHYIVLDEQSWLEKLNNNHFKIEKTQRYFTPRQAFWFSVSIILIFRVFATAKFVKSRQMQEKLANMITKFYRGIFLKEQSIDENNKKDSAGFLLLVARKMKYSTV